MGHYKTGQVCLNGHQITGDYHGNPEFRQDYCDRCGEKTIIECQQCRAPIRGYYESSPGRVAVIAIPRWSKPNYCYKCGTAFPWAARKLQAAIELADEIEELNAAEKETLKESLGELIKDNPRTELAAVRFKKLVGRAAPVVGGAIKEIMVSIATDAAKKSLGL